MARRCGDISEQHVHVPFVNRDMRVAERNTRRVGCPFLTVSCDKLAMCTRGDAMIMAMECGAHVLQ